MDLLVLLTVPLITGLLCRLVPRQSWAESLNAVGATVTLGAGLALALRVFRVGQASAFGELLYVDALSALLIVVIVVVGFLAALYSIGYMRRDVDHGKVRSDQIGWYYLCYHAFVWTMLAGVVVNNLGLLWVAIEATTIVSALLVGFYGSKAALEAAWKYLILCTVGITFALFGVLLTYYASERALGEEAGLSWTALAAHAGQLDPGLMKLAFVFVLIGFGTKAGFAPLHNWLPDAHSQAPSPVSAVLSGVLLKCGLYGVLRFHLITVGAVGPEFSSNLLLGFGLLSVVVAVPFILVQRDLKRLLAYHSVEHLGLIAVAIGLGGPIGLYAGLLHLFNHAMAKGLLFFVAGNLSQRYGTTQMARIRSAIQVMPSTGVLLLLGTFAITGVPPFAVFVTEFGIVGAGFASGKVIVAVVLIVALAIVFAGAFGHALDMAFGRPRLRLAPVMIGPFGAIALAVPTAFMVLFGVYVPGPVSQAVQQAVAMFGGGLQ
ncbi:MAG: hydrogenase 4 subunit F [Chloroflexi bacterium]|nr:hydrogenase 4 subunit F [Chloroflexota bacterium]